MNKIFCNNHRKDNLLSIMTWNLFFGTDFLPLFSAPTEKLPEVVTQLYTNFLSTNFQVRANAIARKIKEYTPDIIGLQESAIFEFIPPNTSKLIYDYIKILLCELKKIGLHYKAVEICPNATQELSSSTGINIEFTDRIVILVNEESGLYITNSRFAHYQTNLEYPFHGTSIVSLRGWTYIDVCFKGSKFRVINTHLEAYSKEIVNAQINELLNSPANTSLPIILIGDLNLEATDQSYNSLISAGFKDTWLISGIGDGLTCCQDENLLNVNSNLKKRIDYILVKNNSNLSVIKSNAVGNMPHDKSYLLQWPSDHAGVVTTFKIPSCCNY